MYNVAATRQQTSSFTLVYDHSNVTHFFHLSLHCVTYRNMSQGRFVKFIKVVNQIWKRKQILSNEDLIIFEKIWRQNTTVDIFEIDSYNNTMVE